MKIIKKLTDKDFVRFLIVGAVNTVVGTGIMFMSYNLFHLSYWVSSGLNYFITSILSYILNKYYTFKSRETSFRQIIGFALNVGICYFIAYALAKPAARYFLDGFTEHIQENVAMFVGMFFFSLLNYIGQKFIVFKKDGK